jgi:hypothetical protein
VGPSSDTSFFERELEEGAIDFLARNMAAGSSPREDQRVLRGLEPVSVSGRQFAQCSRDQLRDAKAAGNTEAIEGTESFAPR